MVPQLWKDVILLCTIIFISYPKYCTSDCDALPYRQEVNVVCKNSRKQIIDCYSTKLPSGTTAAFQCADHYIPAVTMKYVGNRKQVLKCNRGRHWNGYQYFQLLLCQVDCGVVRAEGYIIGGQLTNTAQWPWNAAIFVLTDNRFIFNCGGTLIDTINEGFLVLTAAHCMTDKRNMRVALGGSSSDYETVFSDKNARMFKVKRAVRHEKYTPSREFANDIALLQLDSPICLAANIIPACLPRSDDESMEHEMKPGALGDVVGFGYYNSEFMTSPRLRHTRIPVVPPENCNSWRNRELDSSEICAGHLEGEKGTCGGDSGAGLLFQYAEASVQKKYVLGIVSHGPNLNGKYCKSFAVFTKVSHFIPWIQDADFPDDDSTEYYYSRIPDPQKCGNPLPQDSEWMDSSEKFERESTDYKFPTISTTESHIISTTFRPNRTPNDIQMVGLDAHNRYRRSYGVNYLRLNSELTSEAQSYANYLIREHININQPGKNLNKNLFEYVESGQRKDASEIVRQAVDYWYNQRDKYDRNYPIPSTFTQVVWRSTTDLGIGLASQDGVNERRTIVVAAYSPPGNTVTSDGRYFRENVPA